MSNAKRICFINYYLYNLYNTKNKQLFGGAEIQLFFIIEALKRNPEYSIQILGLFQNEPEIVEEQSLVFWNVQNSSTSILYKVINFFRFFWYLFKMKGDVYVIRTASSHVGHLALFCKIFRKKFIYMAASMIDVDGRYIKSTGWLTGKFFLYGLHNSYVIAQNQQQVDLLRENYGIESKLMYNGIAIPNVMPAELKKDCILWVGRADNNKQPMLFVNLARAFPQEQFMLITILKDTHIIEAIRAAAKELPNLTVYENIPFFETDQYYRRAKILVNTSGYEGFPNTFLHAGAYFCPVLSLNVNPDGLLTSNEIGWCAEGSEDRLHNLLRDALIDESLRTVYGMNARKYIEKNHDIIKNINTFIDVL